MDYKETINIKELRDKSVEMLADIKESLDRWNVNYWLDFGSLLGAMRDGRSIIWDGDFDLSTLDKDIAEKSSLWNEIANKGYNINISYSNIKITKKNWKIGSCILDVHRYRETDNSFIEYEYGEIYRGFIQNKAKAIDSILSLLLLSSKNEKKYGTFDAICKTLLNAGIPPDQLEKIGQIAYTHGKLNSHFDFSLETDGNIIKQQPPELGSRKRRVFFNLIRLLPAQIVLLMIKGCNFWLTFYKPEPAMRVTFHQKYFSDLTLVTFHGMKFKAPNPTNEYLQEIYGENWKTPRVKWEISSDSPKLKESHEPNS